MYRTGPYTFTETDAARTIALVPDLWAELVRGRDPSVIEALSPSLDGDVADVLERAWNALLAAGPALRAAGQLPARACGRVEQLSLGGGGVPKLGAPGVDVDWGGVVGDRQRARQHHGRPWQALCIWSKEVIGQFNRDGHRLTAGAAGENVTVAGLHWPDVRPGVRLHLGSVVCEVSAFAVPCKKNAQWFAGGQFSLMHHDQGPVSRVYATVLRPGRIDTGDEAVLEP